MASRFKPSTRVAFAAPVLVLAAALAACHPPHEKAADANAEYTLPSYTGAPGESAGGHGAEDAHGASEGEGSATTTVTVTQPAGAEGAGAEGAAQGAAGQGATGQGAAGQGAAGQAAQGAAGQGGQAAQGAAQGLPTN